MYLRHNQSETIFVPGVLSTNTTYYWRVDAVSVDDTYVGPVWCFTTVYSAGGKRWVDPVGADRDGDCPGRAFDRRRYLADRVVQMTACIGRRVVIPVDQLKQWLADRVEGGVNDAP